jgi:uncharacterized membrane protein YtjA (UPF0391 family)
MAAAVSRTSSRLATGARHRGATLPAAAASLGAKHHRLVVGKFRAVVCANATRGRLTAPWNFARFAVFSRLASSSDFSLGRNWRLIMLYWALVFLVIALIAGALGFGGIAGASAGIAKILFFVFLVLLLISLVTHVMRGSAP